MIKMRTFFGLAGCFLLLLDTILILHYSWIGDVDKVNVYCLYGVSIVAMVVASTLIAESE